VETPFAPLTQGYQTCRNDPFTTFVTAAGASAGNVTLLSPAGVAVVLCILALYQVLTGEPIQLFYCLTLAAYRSLYDAGLAAESECTGSS
jgi:hypothetical protein